MPITLAVPGKAPAADMLTAVEALIKRLKLATNTEKTHCCWVPEDSVEFLGYRIGRNYRRETGRVLHRHAPERGERSEHLPSRK